MYLFDSKATPYMTLCMDHESNICRTISTELQGEIVDALDEVKCSNTYFNNIRGWVQDKTKGILASHQLDAVHTLMDRYISDSVARIDID